LRLRRREYEKEAICRRLNVVVATSKVTCWWRDNGLVRWERRTGHDALLRQLVRLGSGDGGDNCLCITQTNNSILWDILYYIIALHMANGSGIAIPCTELLIPFYFFFFLKKKALIFIPLVFLLINAWGFIPLIFLTWLILTLEHGACVLVDGKKKAILEFWAGGRLLCEA